jgi:GcrA cell cycle regulator
MAKARDNFWPEARVKRMLALMAQGKSSAQIAKALGKGITRNAVLGKIHRLKLAGELDAPYKPSKPETPKDDPEVVKVRRVLARQHRPSYGFGAAALPTVPVPPREIRATEYDAIDPKTPGLLRMMELRRHHCRWPLNNALGGEYYFCGDQKVAGRPYCEKHAAIAYHPPMRGRNNANTR